MVHPVPIKFDENPPRGSWDFVLTLLSPSYFEVYQAQGGGGGGHIVPPPEFLYFSADCYEIWYICKTSHDLKDGIVEIYQGHHMGEQFYKMWPKIRK